MSTAKMLCNFGSKQNGSKAPAIAWNSDTTYLAVGTENRYVYVIDRKGKIVSEKEMPIKGRI